MDRYFTSVSLAKWASKKNITRVGTMKHDRKGISRELKPIVGREEKYVMKIYIPKEKIILLSNIGKKKSSKKNVIALPTMHDNVKSMKELQKKPRVHTIYDPVKGGVVNLLSTTHST